MGKRDLLFLSRLFFLFSFTSAPFFSAYPATVDTPSIYGRGGTYVAGGRGLEALFQNPAMLSRASHKAVQLPRGNGSFGFDSINVLTTANEASQNPDQVHKLLTPLIGKHGHANWSIFPAYAANQFALGGFYAGQIDADIHNPVIPEATLSYLTDTGIMAGWAKPVWRNRLAIGMSALLSHRYGGVRTFELDDFIDPAASQNIGIPKSRLYLLDFDFGLLYSFGSAADERALFTETAEWRPALGLVIHRILGSQLGVVVEDPKGDRAEDLRWGQSLDFGVSVQSPPWKSHSLLIAADFRSLGRSFSPARLSSYLKHFHLGTELQLFHETLFLRGGLYQGYPAGGIGISAGKISIDASLHQEELGELGWARPDLRGSLSITANWPL
ncbi:MAG: hypothetical protein HY391_03900 [Deltaproteobacteria bacterium]|nr:hypothetical protein [Deltaproteobacteria bacterium]